jgi:dethiobiotin synthase
MSRGLFITGTGTGVGKTIVAAGLLRWLRAAGRDAVPMKPVQTGCGERDGALTVPDLDFSLAAAGLTPSADELGRMCPFRYAPACSPHLAGRMAERYADVGAIVRAAEGLGTAHELIVAEGAGGVMVPLNEVETMLDLMRALGWPVVVVAGLELGTINHTLLTVRALREAGLHVPGVIFNEALGPGVERSDEYIRADNPPTIVQFSGVESLGVVPWLGAFDPADPAPWARFEAALTGLARLTGAINLP